MEYKITLEQYNQFTEDWLRKYKEQNPNDTATEKYCDYREDETGCYVLVDEVTTQYFDGCEIIEIKEDKKMRNIEDNELTEYTDTEETQLLT